MRTYTSAAVGEWTKTGGRRFVWAYSGSTWDEQNALTGRFTFVVTVTVNDTSDGFTGTFTGGPVDDNLDPITSFEGTVTGRRLLTVP